MAAEFLMWEREDGKWDWRLEAGNHVTVIESQVLFTSKSACRRAITRIREQVMGAKIKEVELGVCSQFGHLACG